MPRLHTRELSRHLSRKAQHGWEVRHTTEGRLYFVEIQAPAQIDIRFATDLHYVQGISTELGNHNNQGGCSILLCRHEAEATNSYHRHPQSKKTHNSDTPASMNNLTEVLSRQGTCGEAEEMQQQILGLKEIALGKEHEQPGGSAETSGQARAGGRDASIISYGDCMQVMGQTVT